MRRGFTIIEALIALGVVTVGIVVVVILSSRKFVDDGDATKAAIAAGFTEAKVVTRYNVLASRHGCSAADDLAFDMKAKDAAGNDVDVTVCCGAWYKGCAIPKK